MSLRLDDLSHVLDHALLNLQVYLQLNVLQLQNVVLDDDLEVVPVLLRLHLLHDVLPDFLGSSHRLHYLEVGDLLLEAVLVRGQLEGHNHSRQILYLPLNLLALLSALALLQEHDVALLFPNLQDVEGVLFLNLHHSPPQLDPLIKVLKYLLLDYLHLLFLVHPSARLTTPADVDRVLSRSPVARTACGQHSMPALNPWQSILIL